MFGCFNRKKPVETGPAEWDTVTLPIPADFKNVSIRAISGSGPNDVWVLTTATKQGATERHALSFHFDGTTWTPVDIPARATNAIVAFSPTNAWSFGAYGTFARWNGQTWSAEKIEKIDFDLIAAAGWPNDIWVAATGTELLHFDGTQWAKVDPPAGGRGIDTLLALPDHELVVPRHADNEPPSLARFQANAWRVDPVGPGGIKRLAGTGPRDLWAIGAREHAYHFDGFRWEKYTFDPGYVIGAYATSPTEAYLVGEEGAIWTWNGAAWKRSGSGTRARLWTVYAPPGGAPLVGGDGVLLRKR